MTRPWRGQRSERFYVEAMTEFGDHLSYIKPKVGGVIAGQTGAQITRTLSGIVLAPGDWEDLDLNAVRLRPVMVIDETIEEPLGVFAVDSDTEHRHARGTYLELQCKDLGVTFQDPFESTFNVNKGGGVGAAIASILDSANVYDRAVVDANPPASAWLGKQIGAPKWDALDKLTTLAGLTSPWVDRQGTSNATVIPYIGVTRPAAAIELGEDSPIVEGTLTRVRQRWNVPNTWMVIGRSEQSVKYVGRYTLPSSHPMSVRNRHRTIAKVVEIAGIATQVDADARARDLAQTDPRVHETVEFDMRADPTLEPWNIYTHDGQDWLLDSWSQQLAPGKPQHVKLREAVVE